MTDKQVTVTDIRLAAMNLLAMREHSARELQRKLGQRFDDTALIAAAIAGLSTDNLQSDERYTEAFISMRKRQGKGPVRIALELKEKGISATLIDTYLDAADPDWFELASAEKQKRFGAAAPANMKEKARQVRFLQYRGFTQAQTLAAIHAGE